MLNFVQFLHFLFRKIGHLEKLCLYTVVFCYDADNKINETA
uniref:Uncharacterized protein n=1 Tax=Anguilla anguilla TaxID=7936 RepID=A0A0E9VXH7_ANGAN